MVSQETEVFRARLSRSALLSYLSLLALLLFIGAEGAFTRWEQPLNRGIGLAWSLTAIIVAVYLVSLRYEFSRTYTRVRRFFLWSVYRHPGPIRLEERGLGFVLLDKETGRRIVRVHAATIAGRPVRDVLDQLYV